MIVVLCVTFGGQAQKEFVYYSTRSVADVFSTKWSIWSCLKTRSSLSIMGLSVHNQQPGTFVWKLHKCHCIISMWTLEKGFKTLLIVNPKHVICEVIWAHLNLDTQKLNFARFDRMHESGVPNPSIFGLDRKLVISSPCLDPNDFLGYVMRSYKCIHPHAAITPDFPSASNCEIARDYVQK
jgi:hypothetical protein